jgi:hypothetical protein
MNEEGPFKGRVNRRYNQDGQTYASYSHRIYNWVHSDGTYFTNFSTKSEAKDERKTGIYSYCKSTSFFFLKNDHP